MIVIPVLVNVAFVTLLERKILGLSQLRLGPNKVSIFGLAQPFRDAIKLLTKQIEYNTNINVKLFYRSPVLIFVLVVVIWITLPIAFRSFIWRISFLLFLTIISMTVYPLFITGWASNRKYSTIGAIRRIAQTISYEISIRIILIVIMLALISFQLQNSKFSTSIVLLSLPLRALWFVIAVAETNRTPFDFSEGESELVSGFNIEYASFGFVLIFLSEYARIIMFSSLTTTLLFGINLFSLVSSTFSVLISSLWILLRRTYPRYRYDLLIGLAWKRFLPYRIGFVILVTAVALWRSG